MDAHVVLVVGGAGEAAATVRLRAGVGPLACVGAHVYFTDVRCGEGAAAALEGAPEWAFTCEHGVRGVGWLRERDCAGVRSSRSQCEQGKAQPTGVGPDVLLQVS